MTSQIDDTMTSQIDDTMTSQIDDTMTSQIDDTMTSQIDDTMTSQSRYYGKLNPEVVNRADDHFALTSPEGVGSPTKNITETTTQCDFLSHVPGACRGECQVLSCIAVKAPSHHCSGALASPSEIGPAVRKRKCVSMYV